MDLAGCGKLDLGPLAGYWYRALRLRYWERRLLTDHSTTARSRFSAGGSEKSPGPRMLYLGANHQLAFDEVEAIFGDPGRPVSDPRGSWVAMSLRVRLFGVADLSAPGQQELIGTSAQEVTGRWLNAGGSAPTQQLGAALFAVNGLEAFIYPSAKANDVCLAIFMDKLSDASFIEFTNEIGKQSGEGLEFFR